MAGALATAFLAACGASAPSEDLLFVDGRAVAAAADTVLAVTRSGLPAILLLDRRTGQTDTLGLGVLESPLHIQEHGGQWYVSDGPGGRPVIAVLDARGALVRRIDLGAVAAAPHHFAVLPDGRIVVEGRDGELVVLTGDRSSTFAVTARSTRPGLVMAARGGVLHAIPGRTVILYNEHGNIRWRLVWPWREQAHVADLAVDAQGRIHLLAGEEGTNQFVVFTLSHVTGEVVRWSVPGPYATFSVKRLGAITPDSIGRWFGG